MMDILDKIEKILVEKIWSAAVKTDWSPPEGLFTKSAKEIADVLAKASKDLSQAMSRLQFYISRAGKNLSKERKNELEKVKPLIKKAFKEK